jgi:hypothetical protein
MIVKKINIGGQERPFLFDLNAAEIFDEASGKNFFLELNRPSVGNTKAMIYAGLKNGAIEEGIEALFTLRDVGKWITGKLDHYQKIIGDIVTESLPKTNSEDSTLGEEKPNPDQESQ